MDLSCKVVADSGSADEHYVRYSSTEIQADVASSPLYNYLGSKIERHSSPKPRKSIINNRSINTENCPSPSGYTPALGSSSSLEFSEHLSSEESDSGRNGPNSSADCYRCDAMAYTANHDHSGLSNRRTETTLPGVLSPPGPTSSDSEGSSDAERPRRLKRRLVQDEFNNNSVAKRKHYHPPNSLIGRGLEMSTRALGCSLCGRRDFSTIESLESHMESSHADEPARCESCNLSFKSHRALNLHRFMIHYDPARDRPPPSEKSVVGFHDLTFVDFSADKFPAIARAMCEQSLHRPPETGETPRFQCSKCLRGFPCRMALDAHESDCGSREPALDGSNYSEKHDDHSTRDDFFAGLDLQNKAALNEAKEGRDLADIQSIISVTSGPPMLHNLARTEDASTPDNCAIRPNCATTSSGSSGTAGSEYQHEEEQQDAFAAEFRRMKLKGEFPCRLCSAVFPNLRALKGHNRAHMGVAPGMAYPCNMCPYSSTDKATLVRHLRSHNGDRPYECSLCNYAFTTKANCERHVRNRHGKVTRDEIKSVLIYHPSEDSTNDVGSPRASYSLPRNDDDVRKTLVYPEDDFHYKPIKVKDEAKLRTHSAPAFPGTRPDHIYNSEDNQPKNEDGDSRSSDGSASPANDLKTLEASSINPVGPIDLKKTSTHIAESNHTGENEEEAPLDLSMDVLDLSKKASEAAKTMTKEDPKSDSVNGNSENLSTNSNSNQELYDAANRQLLLTQALLKAGGVGQHPSFDSFYVNPHMFYRNFSGLPASAGILPPYLFNPLLGQELAMKDRLQKDLVRGLQTSGGSLVEPPATSAPTYPTYPQSARNSEHNDYSNMVNQKRMPVREKVETSAASNSVKMVIKNGVLMPKQKQRRYRTERPFTCEHCTARFTLRSNMERHIKQQHPQYWSQRPRGGHSNRGRPPANPPTLLSSQNQSLSNINSNYPTLLPKLGQPLDYNKQAISDEVKYAILAQQLKSNISHGNASEEDLVIDEENAKVEKQTNSTKEPTERTLSLLRGKLEANIESKTNVNSETKPTIDQPKIEIKQEAEDSENNENKPPEQSVVLEHVTKSPARSVIKEEWEDAKAEKQDPEDLASVSQILDNASQHYQQFQNQYISDEDGLVASTSDCSGGKSDSFNSGSGSSTSRRKKKMLKKKKKKNVASAYSMAPNRVICPYCQRPFPWTSSLRRHILTHTGQKPYQCMFCHLLFTTKSNCDRHLLRKHKNSVMKMRNRPRSISSPEVQEPPTEVVATTITNLSTGSNMRNVPERPYKCTQCPSSTFSTVGNLKKHRSSKHPSNDLSMKINDQKNVKTEESLSSLERQNSPHREEFSHHDYVQDVKQECNSGPECGTECQDYQQTVSQVKQSADQSGYDSPSSGMSDNLEQNPAALDTSKAAASSSSANNTSHSANESSRSRRTSPRSSPGLGVNSDTPFKCHLCDSGFAERQDCLDHIKDIHKASYDLLVNKGVLDMDIDAVEDVGPHPNSQHPSDDGAPNEERRGRFPDYSNRKVICAFCLRRFWSAEDLRRHMRTHTGERPFSCDICGRRFTLKHSMLRHRKKHDSVDSSMYIGTSGDEEAASAATSPTTHQLAPISSNITRSSLPQVAAVATADAAPSSLMRFNPYEKLTTLTGKLAAAPNMTLDANDNNDNDLISNLLGIRDKSIIDKALQASADDAAKLIGVKGSQE